MCSIYKLYIIARTFVCFNNRFIAANVTVIDNTFIEANETVIDNTFIEANETVIDNTFIEANVTVMTIDLHDNGPLYNRFTQQLGDNACRLGRSKERQQTYTMRCHLMCMQSKITDCIIENGLKQDA